MKNYKDAEKLINDMKTDAAIKKADLSKNFYVAFNVEELCEALKINKSLKELNLSECALGGTGIANIAEALKTNRTLKILDLSYNYPTYAGMEAFAKNIAYNETLIKIELKDYGFDYGNLKDIVRTYVDRNIEIASVSHSLRAFYEEAAPDLSGTHKEHIACDLYYGQ